VKLTDGRGELILKRTDGKPDIAEAPQEIDISVALLRRAHDFIVQEITFRGVSGDVKYEVVGWVTYFGSQAEVVRAVRVDQPTNQHLRPSPESSPEAKPWSEKPLR
jgi:hypothetical protein